MGYFYKILTILLLSSLATSPMVLAATQQFVVVIDPGHGGRDVGTPHRKCKTDEKVIALNVAMKLGDLIKKNHPDVKIVYTRTTDVYPTLPDRTRIAKESKGHLFISIHVNGALDASARGFETYVFGITGLQGKSASEQQRIRERTMAERENLDIDGNQIDFETAVDIETKILCQAQREKHNKYSQEVAHYVQSNLMADLRQSTYKSRAQDRGVKQKNIFVLCYSPMPAILVELGYMSNTQEEKFITTPAAQDLFAQALYKGFSQYKSNWTRRQLKDDDDVELEPLVTSEPVIPVMAQREPTPQPVPVISEPEPAPKQPEAVKQPETAQEPVVAKQPEAVKQPEVAKQPEVVKQPEVAKQPEVVKQPEVAKQPEPVKQPEAVKQPEVAKQPEVVKQPEPVQKPQVVKQPETSNQPAAIPAKACFRIQFLSSTKQLKKGDAALKGLWPVCCYKSDGYYRYTYGEGTERGQLQADIQKVRKSFPDAFIVRFDANGNRVK